MSARHRVLALSAPSIAASAGPGQFVHLRIPRFERAMLRRPFSVFMADKDAVSILYKVVGRGTAAMALITPGEEINLIGPLGNGFAFDHDDSFPVIVAGGYGVAPLHFLASRLKTKGAVFIGGATAEDILCVENFKAFGWDIHIATEDGSLGGKGLVTHILDAWLRESPDLPRGARGEARPPEFFACGPNGMLKAVGDRAMAGGWKAWLSIEKRMGCGVGACLACVQKVRRADDSNDWARVCRDGPVFESREIIWEI